MCKKLVFLTLLVLMLGLANNAQAIQWRGSGTDKLWSNPVNWEGNKVPTAADEVYVEVPFAAAPNGPVIQNGIDAQCSLLANEIAGEPAMTMTGGTLTISGWGIWWGDGGGCNATFTMSGGTMTLTGSPGIHEFAWGGAASKWIMTGGEVFAKGVKLTTSSGLKGELLLHGGIYNIGTARGGLDMSQGNGLIDITKGTLILEGDETAKVNSLVAAGKITAYGGAGQIVMDFDGRHAGKTTVTAVEAGKAYKPDPADGAYHAEVWANLSWSPASNAASHNVYFGTDFDSVNNGTGDTFRGNQVDLFYIVGFPGYPYPDGLVPGTTYYWRIDEVEANGTVHRGDVWSFTVPPKTAYKPSPADGAESVKLDAQLSWTPGFGAVFHTVYFGNNYDTVSAATGGTQQAAATYNPGPLQGEKIYYWRVDESDAVVTYKGNIWAFTTPGAAGNPQPSNGAVNVPMNKTLSWTPATTASSHDLYLGTDRDAVRNATSASPEFKGNKARGTESYDPGKLAWHSPYYWRVDAVYPAPASAVKGLVWDFTTADFISVDDFESYNDVNPGEPGSNRIMESWDDGFGTTTNGALVGNDLPPYAERAIIHGGAQAMPYSYDNNLKYSEATKTLVYPRDWTQDGVTTLSLWFRGKAANAAEPMYVALNGGAPVYNDNAAAAQATDWQEWSIPLKKFADAGVNLTNVNSITIGLGTRGNTTVAGGKGQIYVDDIRLTRPAQAAETWTYTFTGDAAAPGAAYTALDGTWSHDNGSDAWDESGIGQGRPGGASSIDGYLRLQDPGDPRDYAMPDPSNRKLMFGHSITTDLGAAADNILDGVTISFRARLATGAPLDDAHPDGGAAAGGIAPWPAGGDGYVVSDDGKGNISVRQSQGDQLISFTLALPSDDAEVTAAGLVMNKRNGATPTNNVDTYGTEPGTMNLLPLDPTVWHDFRITIERDATGTGTHRVRIYLDGSSVPNDFIVTAGNGNDFNDSYIAMGVGNTAQSGAIDVDYFSYKPGVFAPAP